MKAVSRERHGNKYGQFASGFPEHGSWEMGLDEKG